VIQYNADKKEKEEATNKGSYYRFTRRLTERLSVSTVYNYLLFGNFAFTKERKTKWIAKWMALDKGRAEFMI